MCLSATLALREKEEKIIFKGAPKLHSMHYSSQWAFTCSTFTIVILEQVVKYVAVLVSLLLTLNISYTLF